MTTTKTCATCDRWKPSQAIRACVNSSDVKCEDWAMGQCEWLGITNVPTPTTQHDFGCNAWEPIGDVLDYL
jgi:hypothetical protein